MSYAYNHDIERYPEICIFVVDVANAHDKALPTTWWQKVERWPSVEASWKRFAKDKGFREGDRDKRADFLKQRYNLPGRTAQENMTAMYANFTDPELPCLLSDLRTFFIKDADWKTLPKWHTNPFTVIHALATKVEKPMNHVKHICMAVVPNRKLDYPDTI